MFELPIGGLCRALYCLDLLAIAGGVVLDLGFLERRAALDIPLYSSRLVVLADAVANFVCALFLLGSSSADCFRGLGIAACIKRLQGAHIFRPCFRGLRLRFRTDRRWP